MIREKIQKENDIAAHEGAQKIDSAVWVVFTFKTKWFHHKLVICDETVEAHRWSTYLSLKDKYSPSGIVNFKYEWYTKRVSNWLQPVLAFF